MYGTGKCVKSALQQHNPHLKETPPFSQINTISQMIISINTTVDCSEQPRFGIFTPRPHHLINAISQLALDLG